MKENPKLYFIVSKVTGEAKKKSSPRIKRIKNDSNSINYKIKINQVEETILNNNQLPNNYDNNSNNNNTIQKEGNYPFLIKNNNVILPISKFLYLIKKLNNIKYKKESNE